MGQEGSKPVPSGAPESTPPPRPLPSRYRPFVVSPPSSTSDTGRSPARGQTAGEARKKRAEDSKDSSNKSTKADRPLGEPHPSPPHDARPRKAVRMPWEAQKASAVRPFDYGTEATSSVVLGRRSAPTVHEAHFYSPSPVRASVESSSTTSKRPEYVPLPIYSTGAPIRMAAGTMLQAPVLQGSVEERKLVSPREYLGSKKTARMARAENVSGIITIVRPPLAESSGSSLVNQFSSLPRFVPILRESVQAPAEVQVGKVSHPFGAIRMQPIVTAALKQRNAFSSAASFVCTRQRHLAKLINDGDECLAKTMVSWVGKENELRSTMVLAPEIVRISEALEGLNRRLLGIINGIALVNEEGIPESLRMEPFHIFHDRKRLSRSGPREEDA